MLRLSNQFIPRFNGKNVGCTKQSHSGKCDVATYLGIDKMGLCKETEWAG